MSGVGEGAMGSLGCLWLWGANLQRFPGESLAKRLMPTSFINLNTQNTPTESQGWLERRWMAGEWERAKESHRFHPPAAAGKAEGVHPIRLLCACTHISVQMLIRMSLSRWNVNLQILLRTQLRWLSAQVKTLPLCLSLFLFPFLDFTQRAASPFGSGSVP